MLLCKEHKELGRRGECPGTTVLTRQDCLACSCGSQGALAKVSPQQDKAQPARSVCAASDWEATLAQEAAPGLGLASALQVEWTAVRMMGPAVHAAIFLLGTAIPVQDPAWPRVEGTLQASAPGGTARPWEPAGGGAAGAGGADLVVPVVGSVVQRRVVIQALGVHLRACGQQLLGDVVVAAVAGLVQCRPAWKQTLSTCVTESSRALLLHLFVSDTQLASLRTSRLGPQGRACSGTAQGAGLPPSH